MEEEFNDGPAPSEKAKMSPERSAKEEERLPLGKGPLTT